MNARRPANLFKKTFNKWSEDRGPRLGAALAYYAIFSIPPLMMIAISAIGLFYRGNTVPRLQAQLARLVGESTAQTLLSSVQMSAHTTGLLTGIIGIAVLLFAATGVFAELQDGLNSIWRVRPKDEGLKGIVRGRFTSFVLVIGICILLLASLVSSTVIAAFTQQLTAWMPNGVMVARVIDFGVSIAVMTILFAMIFRGLPDAIIRWRDVWVGALVTAVLFTIGKFLIGMYIGKAAIGSVYGAAGSIVILVTWVYYSALILYFGAEFTEVWSREHGRDVVPAPNAEAVWERPRDRAA